jgi:hypothetical protein
MFSSITYTTATNLRPNLDLPIVDHRTVSALPQELSVSALISHSPCIGAQTMTNLVGVFNAQ